jgi:hypothetical protein
MRRINVRMALLVAALIAALAHAPAQAAAPKTDSRLAKRFAIEVRGAPVGDVVAQLSRALSVPLTVDASLADQRVNVKAGEATLSEFLRSSGQLLGGTWVASGEGETAAYRLTESQPVSAAASRYLVDRRTQFIRRLQEIAAAIGRQASDRYASDLRRRIQEARPDLPSAALGEVTTDYLRQALLLGPLQGPAQAQLAREGLVSIPVRSLAPAQQQLLLRYAAVAFAGARGFPADATIATPQSSQAAFAALDHPLARLEYRIIYGDAWSDLLLIARVGYPDHWATATLSGLLGQLPDARSLQPEATGPREGEELARRLQGSLSLAGQSLDQAATALGQAAGIKIATDSYARPTLFRPAPALETLTGLSLREALDTLAEAYGAYWWKGDGWYLLRHRLWPEERRVMVPDSALRRLGAVVQRLGRLDGDSMAYLADLDDEHLLTLHLIGYVQGRPNAPLNALDLNEIDLIQRALGFYRSLPPGQQEMAATNGLSLNDMTPAQQRDYAAIAYDYGYIINPADAPNLFFRLTATFPSATGAAPGSAVDGVVLARLSFAPTFTRTAGLSLRLLTPPAPATK